MYILHLVLQIMSPSKGGQVSKCDTVIGRDLLLATLVAYACDFHFLIVT